MLRIVKNNPGNNFTARRGSKRALVVVDIVLFYSFDEVHEGNFVDGVSMLLDMH